MIDKDKYYRLKRVYAHLLPKNLKPPKKIKNPKSLIEDIIVLWRISLNNNATFDDITILPYIYREEYKMDYQLIVKRLIKRGLVIFNDTGFLSITSEANYLLDYYNCILIMAKHPEYNLTLDMFESDPRWHIGSDNDIIWWNFNHRNIDYELNHQWEKLRQNHINKAHLLYEEQKFDQSIQEFTTVAFLSSTGIKDNDVVSVYEENNGYMYSRAISLLPDDSTKYLRRMIKEKQTNINEIKDVFYHNQFIEHYLKVLPFYYLDLDNSWTLLEAALLFKRNICFDMAEMLALRIKLKYNTPDIDSKNYFYNSLENQRKYHR